MKLILRRNNLIGSRIICWFTGEPASHIGVSFDGENVFHSDWHGCRDSTMEDFCANSIYFEVEIGETEGALRRAYQKIGARYDIPGLLGFAVFLIARKLGYKGKIPMMNPRWLFCSEYANFIIFGDKSCATPMQILNRAISELNK